MSNVKDFSRLFVTDTWVPSSSGVAAFNEPINWDTGSATNMSLMFIKTMAFNQPLAFDTSEVTDVSTICLESQCDVRSNSDTL